jgi:DNA mismatch endonuclease (patch repair protein)
MDVLTPEQRLRNMQSIRTKNTKPELQLRTGLFARGLRYRLHRSDLPGRPDLSFPKYRAVIFVHGCFWHGHKCPLFVTPETNRDFWLNKIQSNRSRDESCRRMLHEKGWRVLVVWECLFRGKDRLRIDRAAQVVQRWLESGSAYAEIPDRSR